jgi:hypothetical protein
MTNIIIKTILAFIGGILISIIGFPFYTWQFWILIILFSIIINLDDLF